MKLKLSIVPLLILLCACASLGIPPADTFNKKAAAAVASVNTASQSALTLLQVRKITPDKYDEYADRAEDAQGAIDAARALRSTDPDGAVNKLNLTIQVLAILIAELEARK
jgi:hypothetical protein